MANEDCAHLDDGDACFAPARCTANHCVREFLQNDTDCQCNVPWQCPDLGFQDYDCAILRCEMHRCKQSIMQKGPAPDDKQSDADCERVWCDGTSELSVAEPDLADNDDANACTLDSCSDGGPLHEPIADGEPCQDGGGLCYAGTCYPGCVPVNAAACANEGPGEPENDTATGAMQYTSGTEVCGMLDGADVDWYEMDLVDTDFEENIMRFELHGSPASLEICAFVACVSGQPSGGCSNHVTGPQNMLGCCWEGSPEGLSPEWDLDCTDTSDDSGTLLLSVRAPGGDACETYRLTAHY
jgi:hypothetical protein